MSEPEWAILVYAMSDVMSPSWSISDNVLCLQDWAVTSGGIHNKFEIILNKIQGVSNPAWPGRERMDVTKLFVIQPSVLTQHFQALVSRKCRSCLPWPHPSPVTAPSCYSETCFVFCYIFHQHPWPNDIILHKSKLLQMRLKQEDLDFSRLLLNEGVCLRTHLHSHHQTKGSKVS